MLSGGQSVGEEGGRGILVLSGGQSVGEVLCLKLLTQFSRYLNKTC